MSFRARSFEAVDPTIELDPIRYEQRREEGTRRLNLVLDPIFRLFGFYILGVAIYLHNRFILEIPTETLSVLLVYGLYPIISWVVLRLVYERWKEIAIVFLFVDIVVLTLSIYFSGGDRSYLFVIPLFRVIDQTHTTFRRAMMFGHVAVGSYLALMIYIAAVEGQDVRWNAVIIMAILLYLGTVYTALTARVADANKVRVRSAIDVARRSIGELEAKSAELQRVMLQNQRILSAAGDGIVGFDLEGRVMFANETAAKTVGLEVSDLVGRQGHALALHSREDGSPCDGTRCTLESAMLSGAVQRGINAGFFTGHGVIPVEFICSPIHEEGRQIGAVFTFQDVSERLRMEQELVESRLAAEQASQAKSQFLANMSHELRTPLNAIIGYSEMLQEEIHDSEGGRHAEDLKRIETSGKRLLGLVTDLLDIAKIESGRVKPATAELSLPALAKDLQSEVGDWCREKGNNLIVECDPDIGTIRSDSAMLRRVLLNLLHNANKFTDAGDVVFRIFRSPTDSGRISFSIRDTGIGIPVQARRRLFEPFSMGDSSMTRKHGGAGLGLAVAKRLTELMSGSITMAEDIDRGTMFIVTIPEIIHASGSTTSLIPSAG